MKIFITRIVVVIVAISAMLPVHALMNPKQVAICIFKPSQCTDAQKKEARITVGVAGAAVLTAITGALMAFGLSRGQATQKVQEFKQSSAPVNYEKYEDKVNDILNSNAPQTVFSGYANGDERERKLYNLVKENQGKRSGFYNLQQKVANSGPLLKILGYTVTKSAYFKE